MEERNANMDSVFRYILVAARRAEQLVNGARPRVATRATKPTVIALAELDAGAVPWQRLTAEEYEQLRHEEMLRSEAEERPLPFIPAAAMLEVEAAEADESEDMEEGELEDELEGPDFDEEGLEDVEESLGEDLLVEEVE